MLKVCTLFVIENQECSGLLVCILLEFDLGYQLWKAWDEIMRITNIFGIQIIKAILLHTFSPWTHSRSTRNSCSNRKFKLWIIKCYLIVLDGKYICLGIWHKNVKSLFTISMTWKVWMPIFTNQFFRRCPIQRLEMYENVIIKIPIQWKWPPMRYLGTFVQ